VVIFDPAEAGKIFLIFYPSNLSSGTNFSVKELLFIKLISLSKKDKAFCLCL